MPKSRTKKAAYNLVTSLVYEVAAMICAMILPRFILSSFGSAYNGIVTSATQFLSLISVLSLGVTASTRVALYKTLAKADIEATSSIVKAMDNYMKRIGLILLIYIFILAAVYPLVIETGFPYCDVAILILIVGSSSFAEYFFGITYKTFLAADQCGYISNIFMTIATVLNTVISIVLIKLNCSIQVVKLGSAIVYCLRPLLQNLYVKRKYKLIRNCKPDDSAIKKRGDAMAHALANIVHDNTDIVVLTLFMGVKTVSVYTIYNLVMTALKKIQSILTTGIEPALGNMWVKGEIDKIKKNLSIFEYVISCFVSVAFSTAMIMLLPFTSLYTKGVTDTEYIIPVYAVVITTAFVFQGFRAPYLALVQGIGHYKQTRNGAIAEAIINITVSVILVNFIGITGVAVGTLAANIFRTVQYANYIDDNIIHRGKKCYIGFMLWSLTNIALVSVPGWVFVNSQGIDSWIMWMMSSFLVVVVSIVVVLINSIIFYKQELRYTLNLVKRMIFRNH